MEHAFVIFSALFFPLTIGHARHYCSQISAGGIGTFDVKFLNYGKTANKASKTRGNGKTFITIENLWKSLPGFAHTPLSVKGRLRIRTITTTLPKGGMKLKYSHLPLVYRGDAKRRDFIPRKNSFFCLVDPIDFLTFYLGIKQRYLSSDKKESERPFDFNPYPETPLTYLTHLRNKGRGI